MKGFICVLLFCCCIDSYSQEYVAPANSKQNKDEIMKKIFIKDVGIYTKLAERQYKITTKNKCVG
jgi:hypothetical protein